MLELADQAGTVVALDDGFDDCKSFRSVIRSEAQRGAIDELFFFGRKEATELRFLLVLAIVDGVDYQSQSRYLNTQYLYYEVICFTHNYGQERDNSGNGYTRIAATHFQI